jgi:hypothetical protein
MASLTMSTFVRRRVGASDGSRRASSYRENFCISIEGLGYLSDQIRSDTYEKVFIEHFTALILDCQVASCHVGRQRPRPTFSLPLSCRFRHGSRFPDRHVSDYYSVK